MRANDWGDWFYLCREVILTSGDRKKAHPEHRKFSKTTISIFCDSIQWEVIAPFGDDW